jgi:hypothetical protein
MLPTMAGKVCLCPLWSLSCHAEDFGSFLSSGELLETCRQQHGNLSSVLGQQAYRVGCVGLEQRGGRQWEWKGHNVAESLEVGFEEEC